MKVLVTADAVGGVWNHGLELTSGLTRRGHEVVLVCVGPRPSPENVQAAYRHGAKRLEIIDHDLEWMPSPWEGVDRTKQALGRIIAREDPDIVHLNGYCQDPGGHGRPVVLGAHSSLHGWWSHLKDGPAPEAWDEYAARVRDGLRNADAVVAPTEAMLDEVTAHYGPVAGRGVVIPNGRSPELFRDSVRTTPPARPKDQTIIWSGRGWDPATGIDVLDAAAAMSLPWPVIATGPLRGPDGQQTKTRHVERTGVVSERTYRGLLASASVYVSTSRYEPFGLGPLEAALSGAALVLPDLPSLREIWGDTVRYVPPGRPEALHDALAASIDDPVARGRSAEAAYRRAIANLTTPRMAHGYLELYSGLLDDERPDEAAQRWPATEVALGPVIGEVGT